MFDDKYVVIYQANGKLAAEIIKAFLEAGEIPVEMIQESAGSALGLTIGQLGEVDILVPAQKAGEARLRLEEMERGKLETSNEEGDRDEDQGEDT